MSNAIIIEHLQDTTVVRFNHRRNAIRCRSAVLSRFTASSIPRYGIETRRLYRRRRNLRIRREPARDRLGDSPRTRREFALRGQTLMDKIALCESVAAVNGLCFGGAFDLAPAERLSAAAFSHPGGNLGIMTGWGGTQRLPARWRSDGAGDVFCRQPMSAGQDEALDRSDRRDRRGSARVCIETATRLNFSLISLTPEYDN